MDGVAATIEPTNAKVFYLEGDLEKITIGTGYVMDSTANDTEVNNKALKEFSIVRSATTEEMSKVVTGGKVYGTTLLALESAVELLCGVDAGDAAKAKAEEVYAVATIHAGTEKERTFTLATEVRNIGGYDYYVATFPRVSSIEFAETVTFVFYGITEGGDVYTYNRSAVIADYCVSQFKKASSTEAYKKLMAAILNYGATAEMRFLGKTEGFVNEKLAADGVGGETYIRTTYKDYIDGGVVAPEKTNTKVENTPNILTSAAFSLSCEDEVILNLELYMNNTDIEELDDTVKFVARYTSRQDADGDGEVDEIEIVVPYGDWEDFYADPYDLKNSSGVNFAITGIKSVDIRQTVSYALYRGNEQISDTRIVGIEEYATRRWSNATEQAICAAVLDYCDAACGYFTLDDAQ